VSEPTTTRVGLPELGPDGRGSFEHDGRRYAVFTVDGRPLVVDGDCPHKAGPLAEGLVRDGAVVCPWHWYTFDLHTLKCRTGDAGPMRGHRVEQVDGRWYAWVGPPVNRSWADRLRELARGPSDSS
jgi:nitrite reductase/ring-hydroxylating ferredoxin subunit